MLFGVPKEDGSTRSILNHSDARGVEYSVNDVLDKNWCTVEYAQTKELVEIATAVGKGGWLWAQDLLNGYYNVSVHKDDIYKLGFKFDGQNYLLIRLPMGLSSSPNIFTEFMHFPIWAIKNDEPDNYYITVRSDALDLKNFRADSDIVQLKESEYRLAVIFNYLDDILGGHPKREIAMHQFQHCRKTLEKLSLATKNGKDRPPSQVQKWLGKVYDTVRQLLKLPQDKVNKYLADLEALLKKSTVTKRMLLKHIGRTRHMASIYRPLSAFARNLEVYAYTVKHLEHHIRVTRPLKNDVKLCMWAMTQAAQHGITFELFLRPMSKPDLIISTDAALKIGIGATTSEGHWIQHKWADIDLHHKSNIDIV